MKKIVLFVSSFLIFSNLGFANVRVDALDPSLLLFNECSADSLRISYLSIDDNNYLTSKTYTDELKNLLNHSHIIVVAQSSSQGQTISSTFARELTTKFQLQKIPLTRAQLGQKNPVKHSVLSRTDLKTNKAYRPHPLLRSFSNPPWVISFNFAENRISFGTSQANESESKQALATSTLGQLDAFFAASQRPSIFILDTPNQTQSLSTSGKQIGHQWWSLNTLRVCKSQQFDGDGFNLSSIQFVDL